MMIFLSFRGHQTISKQQGIALVLVLWVALLMSVIAGSFALSARTESLQSRILFNETQARFLAEAGLNRAVFELRNPDPETRWIADGRTHEFEMGDAQIEIKITMLYSDNETVL